MRKWIIGYALLPLMLLAGCARGPAYERPSVEVPAQWPESALFAESQFENWRSWWLHHSDPVLQDLLRRAAAGNLEIHAQAGRIREARALLGYAQVNHLPTLDMQVQAMRQRQAALGGLGVGGEGQGQGMAGQSLQGLNAFQGAKQETAEDTATPGMVSGPPASASSPGRGPLFNLFSISASLQYELDLWGRLAREEEAALAAMEQSVYVQDAILLNVISDVVVAYVGLRAAEAQLRIAHETIDARTQMLAYEEIRYAGGRIARLPYLQARAQLEAAQTLVPGLEAQIKRVQTALALLTGATPSELLAPTHIAPGALPALELPVGLPDFLPSALLERRPDIRAAEAALAAATAQIGIRQAERMPRLDLRAFAGSTALAAGDLFSGPAETGGVSASLIGPVLDFGRNKKRVEAAEAFRDQAEARYRMTVQTAFREVKDALTAFDSAAGRAATLRAQLETLREMAELARARYEGGYIARIELIDAERALLDVELLLIEAHRDQVLATAGLFKALGGGFTDVE